MIQSSRRGPYIPSYLFKRLRELIDIDIPDPSFSHPESRTSMIRLFVSNAHDRAPTYLHHIRLSAL